MNNARMGRLTGAFALASVVIWLGIFPLCLCRCNGGMHCFLGQCRNIDSALTAQIVNGCVGCDPVEPSAHARHIPKVIPMFERLQKCFLTEVFGALVLPD